MARVGSNTLDSGSGERDMSDMVCVMMYGVVAVWYGNRTQKHSSRMVWEAVRRSFRGALSGSDAWYVKRLARVERFR